MCAVLTDSGNSVAAVCPAVHEVNGGIALKIRITLCALKVGRLYKRFVFLSFMKQATLHMTEVVVEIIDQ